MAKRRIQAKLLKAARVAAVNPRAGEGVTVVFEFPSGEALALDLDLDGAIRLIQAGVSAMPKLPKSGRIVAEHPVLPAESIHIGTGDKGSMALLARVTGLGDLGFSLPVSALQSFARELAEALGSPYPPTPPRRKAH